MASSGNASLRQRITGALSDAGRSGMKAGDIAKKVDGTKKEVNAEIYQRMLPEGLVEKVYSGNPPLWALRPSSNSSTKSPADPPVSEDSPKFVPIPTVISVASPNPPISSVPPVDPIPIPDPPVDTRPQPTCVPSHVQESESSTANTTMGDGGRGNRQGSGAPYLGSGEGSLSESQTCQARVFQALRQSAEPLNVLDIKELKKESCAEHVVSSETSAETLEASILQVLRQSPEPLSALSIAKKVGKESAGQVNSTLYKLKDSCQVLNKRLSGESKPLWFANPNLQQPGCYSKGGDAYPPPLATATPSRKTEKLYSREDRHDGQIVFTPHIEDDGSPTQTTKESDKSDPPSARKRSKPRVGLAAVFPSKENARVQEEEKDKQRVLELLARRSVSEQIRTSEIREELGHSTRGRTMIALDQLKKEGKVSEDVIDEISFWKLKL